MKFYDLFNHFLFIPLFKHHLLFIHWNEAIKFHLNSSQDPSSMKITPEGHQSAPIMTINFKLPGSWFEGLK